MSISPGHKAIPKAHTLFQTCRITYSLYSYETLRYKSEGPGIDSRCHRGFSVASVSSMCPGIDLASKNECQDNPPGKGSRCVRLTTYHLHVPIVKKSGALNLLEPRGPVQACNGIDLPLPLPFIFT
jgi:hypothetical protein